MSLEAVEFSARDGYRLAGMLYRPSAPNARSVVINAAAGVRQEYYGKFAGDLGERFRDTLWQEAAEWLGTH